MPGDATSTYNKRIQTITRAFTGLDGGLPVSPLMERVFKTSRVKPR